MTVLHDVVTLDGIKRTTEGYLIADAFTVRTGIQRYAGFEVGKPDLQFVDVYRPEDEVFSHDTLLSFSHVPVTIDHPTTMVTADNWKEHAVGEASSGATRDGDRLKLPLILKDKSAVEMVQAGKRQLSAGYTCQLDFTPGMTADGKPYQAVQRTIRANHVAVVERGRAGPEFRIGDEALKTMKVDGFTIPVTDLAEEAIQKLLGQVAQLTTDNLTLSTEKAALEAENASLKAPKPQAPTTDAFRAAMAQPSVWMGSPLGSQTTFTSVSDSQASYEARLRSGRLYAPEEPK